MGVKILFCSIKPITDVCTSARRGRDSCLRERYFRINCVLVYVFNCFCKTCTKSGLTSKWIVKAVVTLGLAKVYFHYCHSYRLLKVYFQCDLRF